MTRLVEDRQLREAFRRGERPALAEVYREYARPLFGLLREGFGFQSGGKQHHFAGFRDPWELENAVQETFLRAFGERARLRYDGLRPYRNYLFTIARNLVIDEFRRKERLFAPLDEAVEVAAADDPVTLASPPPGPERQAEQREISGHVETFVEGLDPRERRVFDARFRQGASVERAARDLGITEYRVKRTEKKLKKRFFRRMRELGYFQGYRLGRVGLERVGALLAFALGGAG